VGINIAVSIAATPAVAHHMPVPMEPFVELACNFPVKGLAVSLFYNVALVLICTYYAFKTRTVPDNFNESRYITLCVYTTLVIWLAFLPTYFLTSRTIHRVILMSAALLLSGSVLLLSLFASKVYVLFHSPAQSNGNFNFNLRIVKDPMTGPSAASNISNSAVDD
jgi:metabotropic glutamate receptor 2/3/metabotropic glutamate receptor 6/7/8